MDLRYELLAEVGVRDITGYNAMFDRGELPTPDEPDPTTGKGYERLPFIVIVVDELNDLMMVAARDVEASICRIAQMARAVGIHLVIATQRPSVDVITGVIKANVPSRLAFSVSSLADSRVILDQAGAEKLIGKGDMLLLAASRRAAPQRIQGSWVDEECVRKVVAHWRRQVDGTPHYVDGRRRRRQRRGGGAGGGATTTTATSCWPRRWSWWCAAASGPRRCCSASSGSGSPAPGGSWTCSSGRASSARPRARRPGRSS